MVSGEQLEELLSAADTAWITIRGITRQWRRQILVDIAFHRHIDHLKSSGVAMATISLTSEDGTTDPDPIIERVLELAVDRPGRRQRGHVRSRHGEDWLADTVVIDGDTFWARTGTRVDTNDGDPHSSHGGTAVSVLLNPGRVPVEFELRVTGEEVVATRRCVTATATRRQVAPGSGAQGSQLFAMITGGDEFVLSVDLATGVLLRVVKLVDGGVAEVCEFLEIVFDKPLDDSLFDPLT